MKAFTLLTAAESYFVKSKTKQLRSFYSLVIRMQDTSARPPCDVIRRGVYHVLHNSARKQNKKEAKDHPGRFGFYPDSDGNQENVDLAHLNNRLAWRRIRSCNMLLMYFLSPFSVKTNDVFIFSRSV